MFARALPLVGMILFFGIGFLWRSWIQYRRHGESGIVLFRGGSWRQAARDVLFCLLFGAAALQTIVYAFAPGFVYGMLLSSPPAWALAIGSLLLFFGLVVCVAAQLGMGASWRVGIDHCSKPGLVTGGLYQFCRNPIYFGMLSTLFGLAILLPTWISLALVIGTVWSVRTQVIEEEAYLRRTYGRQFDEYAARIGRFIPCVGRLPLE